MAEQPAAKLQLALKLLENVQAHVKIADDKVRTLFGANTLLVAALALNGALLTQNRGTSLRLSIAHGAIGLLILAIGFACVSAFLALMPRVITKGPRSLFFFTDIAHTKQADFISEFIAQDEDESLRQILSEVHINAAIVQTKYAWLRRAGGALIVAILIWLVVQVLVIAG
jgi:hypothetical protein